MQGGLYVTGNKEFTSKNIERYSVSSQSKKPLWSGYLDRNLMKTGSSTTFPGISNPSWLRNIRVITFLKLFQ